MNKSNFKFCNEYFNVDNREIKLFVLEYMGNNTDVLKVLKYINMVRLFQTRCRVVDNLDKIVRLCYGYNAEPTLIDKFLFFLTTNHSKKLLLPFIVVQDKYNLFYGGGFSHNLIAIT